MIRSTCLTCSLLSFIFTLPAFTVYADQADTGGLSPVIVTATRSAQTADETLASVTVITRTDIERSQSQDLYEVLRHHAGIDLARNGGTGTATSLFMRGTNSNHTLILIDGVRAASATNGRFSFHTLDASLIERIEIVRGPRASLYGSDALGGVIQIFTRSSRGAHASVTSGSFATHEITAGYGGGGKIKYNLNVNAKETGGFSATNPANFSFDPDKDGLQSKSINLSVDIPVMQKMNISMRGWASNNETEYDIGESETDKTVANLTVNYDHSNNWKQSLAIARSTEELLDNGAFVSSDIQSERHSVDWLHDVIIGTDHQLTAGLNYYEDDARNFDEGFNSLVFDETIDNSAAFVNWQSQISRHRIQAGARYDKHSNFGSKSTGQIAWGTDIGKVQVRASYGTAFKAPTLNELFHPGFGGLFAGNPDLQPETSNTVEIGALHNFAKNHSMDVSLYNSDIDNLVSFTGTDFQAENVGKATVRGLEISYKLSKLNWLIQHNITLQKTINEDSNTPLLRRADRKMSFSATRKSQNGGNVGTELILSSESLDFNGLLDGYGVLNLFASYPLGKNLDIQWRIENLLDKKYETASGYNTTPASAFVTVKYSQ